MESNPKTKIFKEGKMYVSYNPELDLASCGYTEEKARKNLDEAVSLFLEGIKEKKITSRKAAELLGIPWESFSEIMHKHQIPLPCFDYTPEELDKGQKNLDEVLDKKN